MKQNNDRQSQSIQTSELLRYLEQDIYREWIYWDSYGWPPTQTVFDATIKQMLKKAAFSGNRLSFSDPNGSGANKEVKAYNYFLFWSHELLDPEEDEDEDTESEEYNPYLVGEKCIIEGYDSFSELSHRIITDKKGRLFSVYVNMRLDDIRYEKAFCRFSFQMPGRPCVYTTNEGFYHTDVELCRRIPGAEYQFEIVGLCEICSEKGIVTTIANSMDEIEQLLHCMALSNAGRNVARYDMTGMFRYENTDYRYNLNGEEDCGLIIEDKDAYYCRQRHEFVPKCAMKQAERDCDLCAVFFCSP